jgi:hypothetical protein
MTYRKVDPKRIRELLHYEPETGVFTRLTNASTNARKGNIAGTLNSRGYIQISIDNKVYQAHRLAFAYMNDVWTDLQIDHRDGNRANNKWANLREAHPHENSHNSKPHRDSATGVKGVSWHKGANKWQAQIRANGENIHLGLFETIEEARSALHLVRETRHREFARHA